MTKVVSTRLKDDDLRKIDRLVQEGWFSDRDETIKFLINKCLDLEVKCYEESQSPFIQSLAEEPILSEKELCKFISALLEGDVVKLLSEGQ